MSQNNKIAFIVIPGFAPDNYPVIHLRDKLISLGYHAVAIPFWGDARIHNLSDLTIEQCEEGVANVISSLLKEYEYVIGIGISLGAALLIEYAKIHDDLSHIVSIGTPFKLKNRMIIKLLFLLYPLINLLWQIG